MALKFKLSPGGRIRKKSEQGQRGKAVRHKGQDKGGRRQAGVGLCLDSLYPYEYYTPLLKPFMSSH